MIGLGLVGFGYWGPNLARNFSLQQDARLLAICDGAPDRLELAARTYPFVSTTSDYQDLLDNSDIQAILIATPVYWHYELARKALLAGKDILVEKPFTQNYDEAQELIRLAEDHGRIIAVDHTFLYTGAVIKIKELMDSGELGEMLYFDSVRVNLGLFQKDVNVVYDLAPHDFAILNHIAGRMPTAVRAMGVCHGGSSMESMAYLFLEYDNSLVAHFHLNWLAPVKVRKTLIACTQKMIVWDDLETSEKVKVYDKGVQISNDKDVINKIRIDYRTGDMWAPKLQRREALNLEAEHFLHCVRTRQKPLVDGLAGAEVVRILEATRQSLTNCGERIRI